MSINSPMYQLFTCRLGDKKDYQCLLKKPGTDSLFPFMHLPQIIFFSPASILLRRYLGEYNLELHVDARYRPNASGY